MVVISLDGDPPATGPCVSLEGSDKESPDLPKRSKSAESYMSNESELRVESKVGRVQLSVRFNRNRKVEDDYIITNQVLGTGLNGVVRLGYSKVFKNQKVAVKAFKLAAMYGNKKEQLESEVEVSLTLDHPHIARLLCVYETPKYLHLVMECMEGGELLARLNKAQTYSEHDAADAAWQMLLALNYMHAHGIIHADVKLENFLYDQEGSAHLKLIDFGFSKVWESSSNVQASIGTLSYVAPEVLQKRISDQSDLWSLGVIVFILLAGYMPFDGCEEEQVKAIAAGSYKMKPERWEHVSKDACDFVRSLLQVDTNLRLTADQALAHSWIVNRNSRQASCASSADVVMALREFGKASKFRRVCMNAMAWSLTNEERAQVQKHFIAMDKNQKGTITLTELRDVMIEEFDISEKETLEIFEVLDSNSDELIHYSDFLAAMVSTRIALHDDLLSQSFAKFDVDSSGFITLENMHEILGETFEGAPVSHVMKEADLVNDGKISYPEFVAFVKGVPLDSMQQTAYEQMIDGVIAKEVANEQEPGVDEIYSLVPHHVAVRGGAQPAPKCCSLQ